MYIGIDLGTSAVKLILVTQQGEVIRSVSRSFELMIPKPMWTEQDPNQWYEQTISGLKELVVGFEPKIIGIGFSGQMHGLVLLDENDQILRPAILWNDQRTIQENDFINEHIGVDQLLEYTGNISLTGLTAPKVLWVKLHEPHVFKNIKKMMLPKDYLAYRLSGVFASDFSDISGTLFYDVKHQCYQQNMLDFLEISLDQLPKIYPSYEKIGLLNKTISHDLHIHQPVNIIIGGGDQAVGAVGIGVVDHGSMSISLGTSGVIFVSSDYFLLDRQSYMQSYRHAQGKYHMMGVILNAGGALNWWSEKVFNNYNYTDFFEKLDKTPIDDSLFFLPYLNGERSPINDPHATGLFIGMRIEHRKEHLDRAVIEGISFALKQTYDTISKLGIQMKDTRITGGGAKSKVWAQMMADILNLKISTIEVDEGPAFGAAILSMVGSKAYESVEKACEVLIKVKETYVPQEKRVDLYQQKYRKYLNIYPAVKNLYKKMK